MIIIIILLHWLILKKLCFLILSSFLEYALLGKGLKSWYIQIIKSICLAKANVKLVLS